MKVLEVVVAVALTLSGCYAQYDYTELIGLSNTFYRIQRTGRLAPDTNIPWKVDTFLDDGQDIGRDLTGGYFDAGDFVKFGFPHAGFTTIINWGLIDFVDGYESNSVLEGALATVRHSLDYLLKTHPSPNVIIGQVGDGHVDHAYWGRPQDWPNGPRPSWNITTTSPGSELASEYAAAFASGYLVFQTRDPTYAATLLAHARDAYNFAYTYRGTYTDSIPAADFYNSWSGFGDDLGYGALWMFRATGEASYRQMADTLWNEFGYQGSNPSQFSWDDKYAGIFVLGAKLTSDNKYYLKAEAYCNKVMYDSPRTPKGLVYLGEWGPLRYASNAAWICLNLAELGVGTAPQLRAFAKQQINYMLGDAGQSFVVGYGANYPRFAHHRESSCPPLPATCNWDFYHSTTPNNYEVTGALVGGPDANDVYEDNRDLWQHTEVGCDYNAGFQSNLAALRSLEKRGLL